MSKQIELIQSLSLGLVLAVTASIGSGFLVGGCYAMYHEYMKSRVLTRFHYKIEQLRILSDGRPLIEVQEYRPHSHTRYLDVDRNPVQLPAEPEWLGGVNLPESLRTMLEINRRGPQTRIITVVQAEFSGDQNGNETEDWYFVFEDKHEGHGYFVGFDIRNRERLGYLGTQGFRNDPLSKAEQFRVDGLGIVYNRSSFLSTSDGLAFLQSRNKLFQINLEARTVRLLLGDKDVLTIATFKKQEANWFFGRPIAEPPLLVRTLNQVLLLDFSGELRQTFNLPTQVPLRGLSFNLLPDGNALLVANSRNERDVDRAYSEHDTDLFWATPQGEITKRHVLTRQSPTGNLHHLSARVQSCLVTMAVPAPLAGGTVTLAFIPWIKSLEYEKPYAETVTKSFQDAWPALLGLLILASGLTYLTDRRQCKYGLPRSYAWLVFVFLLGLPRYIAYLVHRPWPIRDPLPPPEPTGLEVFA